jgi:predicted Zn finger-like uncharacterized protein
MEITCEHCNAHLNVPDAKLPPNRRVLINCPKCKNKISIDTGPPQPDQDPSDPAPGPDSAWADNPQSDQDDSVLDIFEEGRKLALIMGREASLNETLNTSAQALGYQYLQVESSAEAISKLRFHHFDIILLSDGFDGYTVAENPILAYLNRQSMSVRRRIFLALIGGAFKTTDNMMAYALSANLVVNEKDLDKLTGILKSAIAENEKFYKIFTDTLVEIGRA